jgi:hypothetical protein
MQGKNKNSLCYEVAEEVLLGSEAKTFSLSNSHVVVIMTEL